MSDEVRGEASPVSRTAKRQGGSKTPKPNQFPNPNQVCSRSSFTTFGIQFCPPFVLLLLICSHLVGWPETHPARDLYNSVPNIFIDNFFGTPLATRITISRFLLSHAKQSAEVAEVFEELTLNLDL